MASTEWIFHPHFPGRIGIWDVGLCEGRKSGVPREKPSEQGREPKTNSTHLCTYQQPSRGGDPRDICGHGAGFVDFCCQFLSRDGGIQLLL